MVQRRQMSRASTRWRSAVIGSVFLVALPGALGSARAQEASGTIEQPGSFDGLLRAMDLKAAVAPAPDFVQRTRPADDKLQFMPVGTPHADHPIKTLSPAEVAATTADLDAVRMTQQRRAGLKPIPVPDKKAAPNSPKPKTVR